MSVCAVRHVGCAAVNHSNAVVDRRAIGVSATHRAVSVQTGLRFYSPQTRDFSMVNCLVCRVTVALLLSISITTKSIAQSSESGWSLGALFQLAPSPLPVGSVGIELSKRIVARRPVGFLVGASLMTEAAMSGDKACVAAPAPSGYSCGVSREISSTAELKGLFTLGLPGEQASLLPHLFAGGGVYFSRRRGRVNPNATETGPSGALLEGGLGWRLPLRITFDGYLRRYRGLPYESEYATVGVRIGYLF